MSVCPPVNLFLGNKVIFFAAIAFYGSPPTTGQAGRRQAGHVGGGRGPRRHDHVVFLRALSVLPCIVRVPSLFHMQPTGLELEFQARAACHAVRARK